MTLKDFLARRKLRAAEFSRLAGIPRCQISLYLSGRRRPGRDNALAIEEATDGKVPVSGWKVQDTKRRGARVRATPSAARVVHARRLPERR